MVKNVGSTDKVIRYILGLVIFAAGFYYQSWWGLVGLVPILTAFVGFCPAFLPFGISTVEKKK
ncbi:MAG: DUF2892 domain-containing protein [Bacteroidetes bacterium]|nr:DUF2892 domain-containing protein [Bacteroidota bacterium]